MHISGNNYLYPWIRVLVMILTVLLGLNFKYPLKY
jgi:hypothetical protein